MPSEKLTSWNMISQSGPMLQVDFFQDVHTIPLKKKIQEQLTDFFLLFKPPSSKLQQFEFTLKYV